MILMCIMLVFAALGTSRTYLACLAMMILLLIIAEKGSMIKKLRLFAILFFALVVAAVTMAIVFPDTFEYFVNRFFVDDITTGRDTLFVDYHNFIVNNPIVMLFGIGLQDYGNRLIQYYEVSTNGPHNSLQEIIIAWGVFGLILFAVQLFSMCIVSKKKNPNQSLLNYIPLIIILFKGIAGQTLTSSYTMLALAFAYLSLCQNLNPTNQSL